jgi:hypothetical protein
MLWFLTHFRGLVGIVHCRNPFLLTNPLDRSVPQVDGLPLEGLNIWPHLRASDRTHHFEATKVFEMIT